MASMTPLENKPNNKCRKWRIFASKGNGKDRVQKSMRFEGTYSEAKAAKAAFELAFRGVASAEQGQMTFSELADEFVRSRKGEVAETTRMKDAKILGAARYAVGDVPIRDVTADMLSDAYASMMDGESRSGKPLKQSYVRCVAVMVAKMMGYAVKRGYIASNPSDEAFMPKAVYEERVPPSPAKVSLLLSGLDTSDPRQMCVYLCASMGLRRGEALALRWQDVDGDVLHVRHSLRDPRDLAPCKTGAGLRDLPIPPHVHDALQRRRTAQDASFAKLAEAGIKPPPDTATWPLVPVCAEPDGSHVTPEAMTNWWIRHKGDFGMSCTLHELRHAYLTAAAVNGVPPRVMQALAGHSSPVTTMRIYAHANMEAKQAASEIVASVLHPL